MKQIIILGDPRRIDRQLIQNLRHLFPECELLLVEKNGAEAPSAASECSTANTGAVAAQGNGHPEELPSRLERQTDDRARKAVEPPALR